MNREATIAVAGSSDRQLNTSGTDVFSLVDTLIDVRGRVVDEKGEPIEGTTVTIKGTKVGTTTDENGYFTLKVVNENDVLIISSVSMETFEVRVNGKSNLSIKLKGKVNELKDVEVVVNTGYQELPKERATGSFCKS